MIILRGVISKFGEDLLFSFVWLKLMAFFQLHLGVSDRGNQDTLLYESQTYFHKNLTCCP